MKRRVAILLLLLIAVGTIGSQLWMMTSTLYATAPPGATLGGYVYGLIFVAGMMWVFSPQFQLMIVTGLVSLVLAILLWAGPPLYRGVRRA